MEGRALACRPSTFYSEEASLPLSRGGGVNTLLGLRKCTFNLGAKGAQEGKEAQSPSSNHHQAVD